MTIETKFNIGDEVWAYLGGQCIKGVITRFTIYVESDGSRTYYNVDFEVDDARLLGKSLFLTKQELLDSL